jgi:cell division transport system permease protein
MRLVGATDWFIRGPFLLEGAFKGLLGGLLAIGMCAAAFSLVRTDEGLFAGLVFFETPQLLLGLLFGTAMGLGASVVSVGRHLRNV